MNMKNRLLALGMALLLALGCVPASLAEEAVDIYAMDDSLTSLGIVEMMGNGINLGNTMEAYGRQSLGLNAVPTDYETCWGQPVTTREMIQGMKAAGFDTLRIPVAWTNTMDFENDVFTIAESYLDRVEEIVVWALEADMYVVLNDHWDGGWLGMFGSATPALQERAMNLFTALWTQVGERFSKYGDHLIFEAANEEFGNRLNDTDYAPDSGSLDEDACYKKVAELNQIFVNLIRAQGGNNARRFLLIPGYNTDVKRTVDDRFVMPTDPANRLLLSVHYYDPSGYCIQGSLNSWGTTKDYEEMNTTLQLMEKYTVQGYGVVIGEYGVVAATAGGEMRNDALKYTANFLNNCDFYGYCPLLWDTNFVYQREKCAMLNDEVAALYRSRSYAAQAGMTADEIKAQATAAMADDAANASEAQGASEDQAIAWIMFNSGNWGAMYSVGDTYDPTQASEGVVATDVEVTGPGIYTVGLDFTGYGDGYVEGTAFSALAISNGEALFPGCLINLKEIMINGVKYQPKGRAYTTSDDGLCTRVNLYNGWVTKLPGGARIQGNNLTGATPTLLNNDDEALKRIETLQVTFELIVP